MQAWTRGEGGVQDYKDWPSLWDTLKGTEGEKPGRKDLKRQSRSERRRHYQLRYTGRGGGGWRSARLLKSVFSTSSSKTWPFPVFTSSQPLERPAAVVSLRALLQCCQILCCLTVHSVYARNFEFAHNMARDTASVFGNWPPRSSSASPQAAYLATFWQNSDSLEQYWEKWFMLNQHWSSPLRNFYGHHNTFCHQFKVVTPDIH